MEGAQNRNKRRNDIKQKTWKLDWLWKAKERKRAER